jgi:hypothetical protein
MVVHEGVRGLESWRLAGADLSQADYTGRTPLHVVSSSNVHYSVKYYANDYLTLPISNCVARVII